jgi:hypothetical protein
MSASKCHGTGSKKVYLKDHASPKDLIDPKLEAGVDDGYPHRVWEVRSSFAILL